MIIHLRELRMKKFLTMEQLAEISGVSVGTIYNWENGKSTPSFRNVQKLSAALQVPPDALVTVEEGDFQPAHSISTEAEAASPTVAA